MRIAFSLVAGLAVALATPSLAQTNRIAAAADAMGAGSLNSIEYSGSGRNFFFGQAFEPGERWPMFIQRVYDVSVNYQTAAMRVTQVRSQGEHPPRGGGAQAVAADQRTVQVVSGKYSWQEAGAQAQPSPDTAQERLHRIWATPHGVIKAALANNGRVDGNTITVSVDGREFKATLNAQNLVEKVTYLSTNEVVGDYPVEVTYSDYATFNGVNFPRHIVQNEDGFPTLDIAINQVRPNAFVTIPVPQNVQQFTPQPMRVSVDKLADGVWYFGTPNARNWAVDFKDYIVVVEGIGSEARSLAVMDEIAKAIPNKPIRYVINTHAHYDHSGGLRTYVAKGATALSTTR